jgi:hypothetical protein
MSAGDRDNVVNFNERRKKKAREEKEQQAAANRILFGRTKTEKKKGEQERSAEVRKLDGARRESLDKPRKNED